MEIDDNRLPVSQRLLVPVGASPRGRLPLAGGERVPARSGGEEEWAAQTITLEFFRTCSWMNAAPVIQEPPAPNKHAAFSEARRRPGAPYHTPTHTSSSVLRYKLQVWFSTSWGRLRSTKNGTLTVEERSTGECHLRGHLWGSHDRPASQQRSGENLRVWSEGTPDEEKNCRSGCSSRERLCSVCRSKNQKFCFEIRKVLKMTGSVRLMRNRIIWTDVNWIWFFCTNSKSHISDLSV